MAWVLFPTPTTARPSSPTVRLTDNRSGRRLTISAAALAQSGIPPKEELVIECDDERPHMVRVRRRAEGEPSFGILSMGGSERSGTFSSGGRALYDAGYRAGQAAAVCGEGWVAFDASVLLPRATAIVPAEPPKPWPDAPAPEIAMEAIRRLVKGQPADRIVQDLGFPLKQFPNVRLLVGEPHIVRLKGRGDVEREEYYAETLPKWVARYMGRAA